MVRLAPAGVGQVGGVGGSLNHEPSTCSMASSSGANAGISLLLASTVACVRTTLVPVSNAESRCTWRPPLVRASRAVLYRPGLLTARGVRVRTPLARTVPSSASSRCVSSRPAVLPTGSHPTGQTRPDVREPEPTLGLLAQVMQPPVEWGLPRSCEASQLHDRRCDLTRFFALPQRSKSSRNPWSADRQPTTQSPWIATVVRRY